VKRGDLFGWIFIVMVAAAFALPRIFGHADAPPAEEASVAAVREAVTQQGLNAEIAFRRKLDKVWVEGVGTVEKTLRDDTEGARHQRFILRLSPRQTLLVAHNIDDAPRLEDLRVGEEIAFRGEYIWNAQGGLLHWTHRKNVANDAGWLERDGRRYD
jgi:hypothetical protein